MIDRILNIVSEILDVGPEEVGMNNTQKDFENWDSVAHLTIVAELEDSFGVNLSPEEIEGLTTVESIVKLLESKL